LNVGKLLRGLLQGNNLAARGYQTFDTLFTYSKTSKAQQVFF